MKARYRWPLWTLAGIAGLLLVLQLALPYLVRDYLNDKLADKNGKLFDGMMTPDNLHPTVRGYQVWADALKPIFLELLGPPAATDQAPPPTGDPSTHH